MTGPKSNGSSVIAESMSTEQNDPDDNPSEPNRLSLSNMQSAHEFDEAWLVAVAQNILQDSRYHSWAVSLAVVDDATIHDLNRRFLGHDYPTDVLSFPLDDHDGRLEGEVVVSTDTAATAAKELGWSIAEELALYVIHGMLHLVGYRDHGHRETVRMRLAENRYLQQLGIARAPAEIGSNGVLLSGAQNSSEGE